MSVDAVVQVKRRWLPVYVLLLAGGLLLMVALLYFYFRTSSESYLSGLILLTLIEGYVGWSLYKLLSVKPEAKTLVTLLRCENCGYEVEREYRDGDSLFSKAGKCPKCGNDSVIVEAIFLRTHKP